MAERFEMRHRFALFGRLQPRLPARLGFDVQRLRDRRRAPQIAEKQNLHLEVAALSLDVQDVAGADLVRGFGLPSIALDPRKLTGPRSERARLEESGGPEPLVHSGASHDSILRYDGTIMMSRTQITLAPELQRRARQRAADLGVSLAEYVRRLVARDLGGAATTANPKAVFDLGSSGGSDVAKDKDAMIAASFAAAHKKRRHRRSVSS